MSVLNNTTVNGVVTQSMAASAANHLVRLGEVQAMIAAVALTPGAAGAAGASSYLYVAYASDNSGTGFSLAPGSGLNYVAFLPSTTVISSPNAGNFAGLWQKYVGADGAAGAAGVSAFNYIAYASDTSGTGFSLTPGSGLNYVAFITSSTVISSPNAGNFTGQWQQYVGAAGATGATGSAGAAGASAYLYIGYASDASGTGFSQTPGSGLNYVAFLSSNVVIGSPNAGNFTGLWKNYASTFTATGPVTFTGGAIGVNSSAANTASYLVQRDSSGNFAAGQVTVTSLVVGSATLGFASSNLTVNTAVTLAGTLTLTGLSGVLVATAGAVAGNADTNAVPEGTVNLATPAGNAYFTRVRVLTTPLTGYTTSAGTPVLLATDTVLAALGKLDAALVSGSNFAALAGAAFTGAITVTPSAATAGSASVMVLTGAANTAQAGGTEASDVVFNFARTVQFNTGALALQRAARFEAPTYAFVGASTLAIAATVGISGAPAAGTNATITLSAGLKIYSGAVGAGTVSAYGLYVDAPTGASNNYAAAFNTGDVLVNAGWLRSATGYGLKVNNVQVVTGRQTGWTAATGTATRTSFATSSVTLPNLAAAVKAIIDDLITHGLIGT